MIAAIDSETTGLYLGTNEMCQLSIILFDKDGIKNSFSSYLKPKNTWAIDPRALEVNGLTKEFLFQQPDPRVVKDILIDWLVDNIKGKIKPLGHFYRFDYGFLELFLGPDIYNKFFKRKYHDTALYYEWLTGVEDSSLETLIKKYGIRVEKRHDAISDSLATIAVFRRLEILKNYRIPIAYAQGIDHFDLEDFTL